MNTHLPNLKKNQLDISGKIKSHHLNRKAVIYIRQSTLQQVHRHQESTYNTPKISDHPLR